MLSKNVARKLNGAGTVKEFIGNAELASGILVLWTNVTMNEHRIMIKSRLIRTLVSLNMHQHYV